MKITESKIRVNGKTFIKRVHEDGATFFGKNRIISECFYVPHGNGCYLFYPYMPNFIADGSKIVFCSTEKSAIRHARVFLASCMC